MGNVHEYRKVLFNDYNPYENKPQQKTFGKWLVYEHGDMMYDDSLYIPAEKILKENTLIFPFISYYQKFIDKLIDTDFLFNTGKIVRLLLAR
jgi:hypothetical protein